jgi:hypothetical protein
MMLLSSSLYIIFLNIFTLMFFSWLNFVCSSFIFRTVGGALEGCESNPLTISLWSHRSYHTAVLSHMRQYCTYVPFSLYESALSCFLVTAFSLTFISSTYWLQKAPLFFSNSAFLLLSSPLDRINSFAKMWKVNGSVEKIRVLKCRIKSGRDGMKKVGVNHL